MNFWDLFWPMFAAQLSVIALMEIFQLGLGFWLAKKQAAYQQKMQEEMLKLYPNGVPYQDMSFTGFNLPVMPGMGEKPSGGTPPADSGQYL